MTTQITSFIWEALLETCRRGSSINLEVNDAGETFLVLQDKSVPGDMDSPFRSAQEELPEIGSSHYSLHAISLLYNCRSEDHDEYINAAFDQSLELPVSFLDRDVVLDVLSGRLPLTDLPDHVLDSEIVREVSTIQSNDREKSVKSKETEGYNSQVERAWISAEELLRDKSRDFSFVLDFFKGDGKSASNDEKSHKKRRIKIEKNPIVLIPNSSTYMVSMQNAKDFFREGNFVAPDSDAYVSGHRTEVKVKKKSPLDSKDVITFHLMDDPSLLSEKDWRRVVAVIVSGQNWQFKGWKIGEDPVSILSRIPGFHFRFKEDPLNPNIEVWNVRILEISKTHRHLDQSAIYDFWNILLQHLTTLSNR